MVERSILDHARALISTVVHRPADMDADTAMMGYVRENLTGQATDFCLRVMATAFVGMAAASDRANIIGTTIIRELLKERDKATDADVNVFMQQEFQRVADRLFPDELGIAKRVDIVAAVPAASGAKAAGKGAGDVQRQAMQDGPGNPHAVMALRQLGEIARKQ